MKWSFFMQEMAKLADDMTGLAACMGIVIKPSFNALAMGNYKLLLN
jgi:hypothetical protein